ncbi:MAG: hypothetical protein QW379_09460 [Thermoplasmata archaeon]
MTGTEALENRTLLLEGNLSVESGGSLTLSSSSLTVYCEYSEEHELRVMPGGTLRVLNGSLVGSFGEWNTFGFWVEEGATVVLEDSIFATCGVRWRDIPWVGRVGGVVILTDDATIRNCTFTGNGYGALSDGSFEGCVFTTNTVGLGGGRLIRNCTFDRNSGGGIRGRGDGRRLRFRTLEAAGNLSASLNGTSLLDCLNSTLDRTRLEFRDPASRVNIS